MVINALSVQFSFSIRCRHSRVSSTGETSRFFNFSAISRIDGGIPSPARATALSSKDRNRCPGKAYNSYSPRPAEVEPKPMSQMTVTPVSTQGFLVDGKWIEQGELQEIRAPFDGSVIAQ